ncbi:hypothetical protein ACROYT_G002848 [Oculina patagonica]
MFTSCSFLLGSVKDEYNNLFQRFKTAWNSCRSFLGDQGRLRVPQDLFNTTMDNDCPIAMLLPSTTGMGVCTTSLTFFLVNTHDEFLGAYRSETSQDRGSTRGCIDNGLGTLQGLRLSTLQSYPSRPKQSHSGQSRHHISGIHLASTTVLATTIEPPGRGTSPAPELQTPPDHQKIHPMFPKLHLAVFHVFGDSTGQWEFQTTLRRFSFRHPEEKNEKHINQLGDAGVAGMLRERLILFQRL